MIDSWGGDEAMLEQVKTLKEADMRYAGVEELKEREVHEGQTSLICRLAGLKSARRRPKNSLACWKESPTRSESRGSAMGLSSVGRAKNCSRVLAKRESLAWGPI